MPYFFVTIDTEADNQWDVDQSITTENVQWLPRFQEVCEQYNYKPVYLITYEVAKEKRFIEYFSKKQMLGLCEIGMHCHAWSTPPNYELVRRTKERPYLIEYPIEIIEEKIASLTDLINQEFGVAPITHRSGRWALNEEYLEILFKYGYRIDCSVTPHISWKSCLGATGLPGTDYTHYSEQECYTKQGILEVPVSIIIRRKWNLTKEKRFISVFEEARDLIFGKKIWMRPMPYNNTEDMLWLCKEKMKANENIEFMIHSSELMPGGSKTFPDKESIDRLYKSIHTLFKFILDNNYKGMTLREYWNLKNEF